MEHQISYRDFSSKQANHVRDLYSGNKEKISDYIDRLLWWNKKINMVSRGVSRETLRHHVEHSLVLAGSRWVQDSAVVVDSGSGGGLPGIPLAIVCPEKDVVLNDIVTKKIMACKDMARRLGLGNVSTSTGSIKDFDFRNGATLISKHAFKIDDLVGMLEGKPWKRIVLLKGGKDVEEEIEKVQEPLSVEVINLQPGFEDSFYEGKAMVEILRKGVI